MMEKKMDTTIYSIIGYIILGFFGIREKKMATTIIK